MVDSAADKINSPGLTEELLDKYLKVFSITLIIDVVLLGRM